jgi:lipoate-protein ligase A
MSSTSSPGFSRPEFPDPPRKNDAIFLYGARQWKPFVFSYVQEAVEVVYGPACNPDKEIYSDKCLRDNVAVSLRRSGGGVVVLSPGMVITIVVGRRFVSQGPALIFSKIHDGMISLLDPDGLLFIQKTGLSDLAIYGKKILGSSLYLKRTPDLYFYQSSLMVSPDISLMARYTTHPLREPSYRKGRDHEQFCTTLEKEGYNRPADEIALLLSGKLSAYLK